MGRMYMFAEIKTLMKENRYTDFEEGVLKSRIYHEGVHINGNNVSRVSEYLAEVKSCMKNKDIDGARELLEEYVEFI